MKYTRKNYEAYVLDFLEGALSREDELAFRAFLDNHPEIAAQLEGLDEAVMPVPANEHFPHRDRLKKDAGQRLDGETDWLLARWVEGDLTSAEEVALAEIRRLSPETEAAARAFARTRLVPLPARYEDKEVLRIPQTIDMALPAHRLIALLEGDLAQADQQAVKSALESDSHLAAAWNDLRRTRLTAPSIAFEHKASLYRRVPRVLTIPRFYYAAVAIAAALLAWVLFAPGSGEAPARQAALHKPSGPRAAQTPTTPIPRLAKPNNSTAVSQVSGQPETPAEASAAPRHRTPDKLNARAWASAGLPALQAGLAMREHQTENPEPGPTPPSVTHETKWLTVGEFLEETAKKTLWGDKAFPEEGFTLALLERTLNRGLVARGGPPLEIEQSSTEETKTFRFRLGKFEFERKRSVLR